MTSVRTASEPKVSVTGCAVLPGATYACKVETVTWQGVEVDDNGGQYRSVTIPSS